MLQGSLVGTAAVAAVAAAEGFAVIDWAPAAGAVVVVVAAARVVAELVPAA